MNLEEQNQCDLSTAVSHGFLYSLFIVCLHTSILNAQLSKSKNKAPGSTIKVPIFVTLSAWSLIFSE